MERNYTGAQKIDQWVKHLPGKHEDLIADLQCPCKARCESIFIIPAFYDKMEGRPQQHLVVSSLSPEFLQRKSTRKKIALLRDNDKIRSSILHKTASQ